MRIQENILLAEHTTFKIGGPARFFCAISDENALEEAVRFAAQKGLPIFVLGGGSNILVSDKGFQGLVIKMEIMGVKEEIRDKRKEIGDHEKSEIRISKSDPLRQSDSVARTNSNPPTGGQIPNSKAGAELSNDSTDNNVILITVGAGELWDGFVDWTVERGLYGIENLSAIPGTVGAAPVQNIGAYGAEASRTISSVRALDTRTMKFVELSNADCGFAYRDSLFKREKGRYVISRVTFGLSKNGKANIAYKDLQDYFARSDRQDGKKTINGRSDAGQASVLTVMPIDPTLRQVREAVINVRWHKLPDWKLWGTAGSFFKNPIIPASQFAELQKKHPDLPGFPEPDGRTKVSLGWILDKICDVKGLSIGKASVYEKQALVLVALPGASAEAVVGLSRELMKIVKEKTGIDIECEVEWVN